MHTNKMVSNMTKNEIDFIIAHFLTKKSLPGSIFGSGFRPVLRTGSSYHIFPNYLFQNTKLHGYSAVVAAVDTAGVSLGLLAG
jgi:predicted alpha/beta hydrolase